MSGRRSTMNRALTALRLEVPPEVADSVHRIVYDYVAELERERDEAQQRLEWVAATLHGDLLVGRGAEEPLVRDIAALRAEVADEAAMRERLAAILTRTAAALKGEPTPLTVHSWHDLAEVAAALRNALAEVRENWRLDAKNLSLAHGYPCKCRDEDEDDTTAPAAPRDDVAEWADGLRGTSADIEHAAMQYDTSEVTRLWPIWERKLDGLILAAERRGMERAAELVREMVMVESTVYGNKALHRAEAAIRRAKEGA